jgi:hypothetical protein
MPNADIFIDYPYELLSYMREIHKPVFHNSNVFLRDMQYSIQDYFEDKEGKTIRDPEAQKIAEEVARGFERKGIFKKVNPQGYLLNFPELVATKTGNTKGGLSGELPSDLPPAKKEMPAPKAAAAIPPKPAPKPSAAAGDETAQTKDLPTAGPAVPGTLPAGAKAPPPWLKK